MTRRELEIQQAMKESIAETIYASGYGFTPQATDLLECAFIKGAQWADKTMIEKACAWLKEYGDDFGVPESESGRVYVDDLVYEFRKAMEE